MINNNIFQYSLSEQEKEYQEEYLACFKSGDINSIARRLLDKLATRLGLTREQVNRLEDSVSISLDENEREYLDEYLVCLDEASEDSPSTHRL